MQYYEINASKKQKSPSEVSERLINSINSNVLLSNNDLFYNVSVA